MIDYEVLLLFDAELPDERQNEIVTRTRELVERGGGTFERHDVWGRHSDIEILCANGDGSHIERHRISALIPHGFGPANLADAG